MKARKTADERFERFFSLFQEAIVRYDDEMYRSDKAYPVLTKPLMDRMNESTHSLKTMSQYSTVFNQERKTLQGLVPQDIGSSPVQGFSISKQDIARESLQETLWYLLAIGTGGLRAIFQLR